MKFNSFKSLFLLITVVLLSSCLGKDEPVVISEDATFLSLTFAANDSIPNLEDAVFTLVGDTIQNVDSLPFQTRIDSVFPTFIFVSSYRTMLNDAVYLTGKDTVDFTQPVKLINYASDNINFKPYIVKVNVHQVEPELYVWNKLTDIVESQSITNQKTIIFNSKIYYFRNNSTNYFLNTSVDGSVWSSPLTMIGLPANASLQNILQFSGKLYLTVSGNVFSSVDGTNWVNAYTSTAYSFTALLFTLNEKMWLIAQSKTDQKYHFASFVDGGSVSVIGEIKDNFPVSDFAALSFSSRSGLAKVIVVGGKNSGGDVLKTNWSTENGTYLVDFSLENKSLDTLAVGASIIAYDNKLFVFGCNNANGIVGKNHFKQSIDEGMSWQTPDSTYNFLPVSYQARNYQSVVVDSSNRIFIVGGKTGETILSDVWTGKLNRKGFKIQ